MFLDWCRFNKMVLNPHKCEYMLLTNKCVAYEPSILLGGGGGSGEPIARTSTYLGTMLDEKLKFNTQIEYVKTRLSQFCGMTYRLKRYYFTLDVSRKFYYSCVYPVITYYVTVWGGVLRCTAKGAAMQNFQTRIVIILFSQHMSDVGICIFMSMNTLRMIDVYTFCVCVRMFKVIKVNISPSLQSTLDLPVRDHPYKLYCVCTLSSSGKCKGKLQVSIYRYMEHTSPLH